MDSSIQGKCPSFVCKKDGVRIQIIKYTINDIKRGLIIYQCVHCRSQVETLIDLYQRYINATKQKLYELVRN